MVLSALPGLGPINLRKLDGALEGGVQDLLEMSECELKKWCPEKVACQILDWRKFVPMEKVRSTLAAMKADFVTFEEEGYPDRLHPFSDRPIVLYRCRGGLTIPSRSIAVVGTRNPSSYGRKVAREFSTELNRQGFCIVSGLAEGIDTEAHRATLAMGGTTLAVLGGGLNCCYPTSNRGLMESIKESGGVWTEFPLWRRADRRSFPQRNRIVAGISEAVVVVESCSVGGSLITARMASEQGKPVYVIPGRIDAPQSAGCHGLIRDGAQLVTSVEELLEDLDYLPGQLRTSPRKAVGKQPKPELQGLKAAIWDFLEARAHAHLDGIANGTGTTVAEVSGTVIELELTGLISRRLDGHYELS